jgi:hypothetical protein
MFSRTLPKFCPSRTLQGDTTVMVERRSSAKGTYGQGIKAPMQLKQLIHELQQGNTGLYMSTQEVRTRPCLNTAVTANHTSAVKGLLHRAAGISGLPTPALLGPAGVVTMGVNGAARPQAAMVLQPCCALGCASDVLLQVGVGRDGHPLLYGAPLVQLEGQFPLLQPLMGHLVPQSVNMWMGCAPEGERTQTAAQPAAAAVMAALKLNNAAAICC